MTLLFSFILPVFLFFDIIYPTYLVIILRRQNKKKTKLIMYTPTIKYGILTLDYKQEAYLYELLRVMNKIVMMFFVNFFNSNQNIRIAVV